MNALVRRYTTNVSTSEKVRIHKVWDAILEKEREDVDKLGLTLPSYGRAAVQFIREMKKTSASAAKRRRR